jgi:hypothetical protein
MLIGNTIERFQTDGISIRFHGAAVLGNHISGGGLGIGVFSFDRQAGITWLVGNVISSVNDGIFVCGPREACTESADRFVVGDNHLSEVRGEGLNLQPTAGGYSLDPSDRTNGTS